MVVLFLLTISLFEKMAVDQLLGVENVYRKSTKNGLIETPMHLDIEISKSNMELQERNMKN